MKKIIYALLFMGLFSVANIAHTNGQCTIDPKASGYGLHPNPLPNGRINEVYNSTSMTVVFNPDTLVTFTIPSFPNPITLSLDVIFSEYVIDSVGGLPEGMEFELSSCNQPNCKYTLPENVSGCFYLTGTPLEFGAYQPVIRATVDGSFIMPELPAPIPGLPAAGTRVILSQAPTILRNFIEPLRKIRYRTTLRIDREQGTGCTPDASYTSVGLYEKQLPDGQVGTVYPTYNLTAVFPKTITVNADTSISLPNIPIPVRVRADFVINYTDMTINGSDGLPIGMDIDLNTCNEIGCNYLLSESDRACLEIKGTPAEDGEFNPTLLINAGGTFVMPSLNALRPFIPGFPRAGTVVSLSEIPPVLNPILEKYKKVVLSNNLTIQPDPNAPPRCNPDDNTPDVTGLYPARLSNGKVNIPYAKTKLTMVFPTDTLVKIDTTISFPGVPLPIRVNADFDIKFTTFVVENTIGLPQGMAIDLASCNRVECTYRLPRYRKGCIEMDGTPTESGLFLPGITAVGDGWFIMPDLGPIKNFLPFPLPEPGERVVLSEATPALQFFLGPIRNKQLRTRLLIEPEQYTELCKPEVRMVEGAVQPARLKDANRDEAYDKTDLVLDFPKRSAIPLPGVGLVQVQYRQFQIDSVGGLPPGMSLTDYCKAGNNCVYRLNEVDTAQNRVCYAISGTPTRGGIYYPRLVTSATGIVNLAGNNFPLESLPPQIPEQIRSVLDSLRTLRFQTYLRVLPLTGIESLTAERIGLELYPNPTQTSSVIGFRLNAPAKVALKVTDITGRVLAVRSEENFSVGDHRLDLSAQNLTEGMYFVQLTVGGQTLGIKWHIQK